MTDELGAIMCTNLNTVANATIAQVKATQRLAAAMEDIGETLRELRDRLNLLPKLPPAPVVHQTICPACGGAKKFTNGTVCRLCLGAGEVIS